MMKIKNPYLDDFIKLASIQRAVNIVNNLIDRKDPMLPPNLKKIKMPNQWKKELKQLEKKLKNWKI